MEPVTHVSAPPAKEAQRLNLSNVEFDGPARAAVVSLPRGSFRTPIFMPVGTQATVKALSCEELESLPAPVILGNSYHLHLRPGDSRIASLGGMHTFMNWPGLILTDSGGFQVFSLKENVRVEEKGVHFKSHIDGSSHFIGPIEAMAIQANLGSDIAMAFDQCPPSTASKHDIVAAMDRTTAWAKICTQQPRPAHQVRFGIVQGGVDIALRKAHLESISALDFEGIALGGLSVGETRDELYHVLSEIVPLMPQDKPRYLMGVGHPLDLVAAIGAGVDMFDCVLPSRNARNGSLFTSKGRIVIQNARHQDDNNPVDDSCDCTTCARYTRAYLAHLFRAKELLYYRLATIHNLRYIIRLMADAREAIVQKRFASFRKDIESIPKVEN